MRILHNYHLQHAINNTRWFAYCVNKTNITNKEWIKLHKEFISKAITAPCFLYSVRENKKLCRGKKNKEKKKVSSALFSPTATSETCFPSLSACVIALHSQMPLNMFDTLTNSPFQCSHHGYSLEMYKKEEEAGIEDKQRAGPASQMGCTTSIDWWNISHII